MVFKFLMRTFGTLIVAITLTTSTHASTVDWSTVTLDGLLPNFSFSDPVLGLVNVNYSNGTEMFGILDTFGGVDTLRLGVTGGETLTISWSNNVAGLEIPIYDIDGESLSVGESVTFVTSAAVSPVSVHPTDIWDPSTLTLGGDGTINTNSDTNNFSVMSFIDPAGFNSVTFNWNIIGDTTGAMGIGNMTVQVVPVPAAIWLFGSGAIGLLGLARRKKS